MLICHNCGRGLSSMDYDPEARTYVCLCELQAASPAGHAEAATEVKP